MNGQVQAVPCLPLLLVASFLDCAPFMPRFTKQQNGGTQTYGVVVRATLGQGSYNIIGVVPALGTQISARLEVTIR